MEFSRQESSSQPKDWVSSHFLFPTLWIEHWSLGGSLPLNHLDGPASRKPGGNSFTLSTNIQSSFHERKERNREKDIFLFIWNGNHIKGNSSPLQYLCLENSIDRGAWKATVHGVTKSWTRLSFHIFTS